MSVAVRAASGPAKADFPDNRFYIGDCLPVLADLTVQHGAFADLVYLDPPFNSARLYNHTFKGAKRTLPQKVAFTDTWKWTDAAKKDFREFTEKESPGTNGAEFLSAMRFLLEKRDPSTLAYLTYMTRRIARIHAAMKPTASIFLHCDPTAGHYLKLVMDAIFGRENCRNDIIWCYTGPGSPKMRQFNRKSDYIFWYSMGGMWTFNQDDVRVPYKDPKQTLRKAFDAGRGISAAEVDKYRARGKILENWWTDIALAVRSPKERLGYATQKPVALLRRIITASSNPGDLVLDPFCGCGTTIAACHELKRRFIGIDVARSAAQVIARRMHEQYSGFGELVVGDKTPTNIRGWGRLLPKDEGREDAPEWARFQYDAIAAIPKAEQIEGEIQRTAQMGGDGGVDGLIHLERPRTRTRASVVIQVKRKRTPSMADVSDTMAAVDRTGAFMGLLITLNPATDGMRKEAETICQRFNGKHYPKVAILTYDEVKAGKYAESVPYEYAVDPEGGKQTGLTLRES